MERTGMEAEGMSLHDLANLAIGTPELGSVNFTALHSLLHAIIRHLHIQDVGLQLSGSTCGSPPSGGRMEHRILHLEKQLEALDSFPSGLDLMERSKSGHQGGSSSVEDMWQMMKMKRRLELNEEGVCKAMMVLQDIMLEVNTLKQSQREVQDQIQKVAETAELETRQRLEQSHSAANTEWDKQAIQIELGLLNTQIKELEEKFDVFHETLARRPETKVVQTSRNSQPSDYDISPMSAPIPSTELSQPDEYMMDYSQRTGQEDDPDFTVETPHGMTNILEIGESGQEYEGDLVHAHPGAPLPLNSGINSSMTSLDSSDAPGSPVVTPALPFGATSKELAMLYRRMDALERDKADRTELRILQDNTDDLAMALQDLQDKMSNVNREIRGLSEGPDMLGRLQGATDLTGTSQRSDQRMGETNLSATMQDIEQELKELRKRQRQEEAMEQSATDKPLYLQGHDGELIGNIQKTMARLQEDCEHLTRTTGSLLQDLDQKQRHIDVLYQKVENLDKNKVHREVSGLETDMEADKRTMESKVSHTHFGATIEELSRNIQGVMGKVSAQERDWQRLWEKTNVEMQNKLDRMELEPLKNILEQCWRDLRHQLQENPPQYEADEAAGVRKQLIRRFHCISCNRTVDMEVPGSEMLSIPNIPGLPAHRSNRPYTVFELDQIRQQSRSDRFPQLSDSGYMSSSRNCGGSHTLTFPQRRYTRLQASTPYIGHKEDFVDSSKEEIYILGQDGQIYRGRRDNHLPAIRTKEDKGSMASHLKVCDCNSKGEENLFGRSSAMASDIHYGLSKTHMKLAPGSEQPLPFIKDSIPPTCT